MADPTGESFTLDDFVDAPPASTAPTDIPVQQDVYTMDDFVDSPLQDKTITSSAKRDSIGPDGKVILNVQAVPWGTRIKTQMFFDRADEKLRYLQNTIGDKFDLALHPTNHTEVIARPKGTKEWGVIDPDGRNAEGTLAELQEALTEGGENAFLVAQALNIPANALSGGLTSAGLEAVRVGLRKLMLPNADPGAALTDIGIAGGAGIISGGMGQLGVVGKDAVVSGVNATQKGVNAATKASPGLGRKVINYVDSPEFMAQGFGLSEKEFPSIVENLAVLKKNHPEFKKAYDSAWTKKGKYQAVDKLLKDTGQKLGQFYENPENTVKVSGLLDNEPIQLLEQAATTGKVMEGAKPVIVDDATRSSINRILHNYKQVIGGTVLGRDSTYMKAFNSGKLHRLDHLKPFGFKSNEEAFQALVGDADISLGDVVAARSGFDEKINFAKSKGTIKALDTARKNAADGFRQGVRGKLLELGGEDAVKLLDLAHELYPVTKSLKSMYVNAAKQPGNFAHYFPSAINGMTRGGLVIASKVAKVPGVRTMVSNLAGDIPLPKGAAMLSEEGKRKALAQMWRGGSFALSREELGKNLLPRESDTYFENSDYINKLITEVDDPDLADALTKQYERGDKTGFANSLSMVASTNDNIFEPAPYKSLVVQDGNPVLMDKFDREQYREHIANTVTDSREKYKALQALNGQNIMIKAPYDTPKEPKKIFGIPSAPSKKLSTSSRVATQLKDFDTVEMDDGTERVDHDY